jgi:VanZ family protein
LTSEKKHLIKTWIAAGLWIGIIITESTNWASAENTSRILYPIFHFLLNMDLVRFSEVHPYLRKCGHFVGYFTLSVLLFGAWRATLPAAPRWTLRWAGIAFFMSAFIASLDEWHQTFLPSRTGNFHDVLLDSFAALVAQFVIAAWIHFRQKKDGGSMPLPSQAVSE